MPDGECRLCQRHSALRESHLSPAFVLRWLKETSVTGKLSSAVTPGKALQDGPKFPLFCSECEQRLGRDEREFSLRVGEPSHAAQRDPVEYGLWLPRFVAGLAFRAAISPGTGTSEYPPKMAERTVVPVWRQLLLGETESIGDYPLHLIPIDASSFPIPVGDADLARRIPWYFTRGVDMTLVYNKVQGLSIMALLPGFLVWVPVRPNKRLDESWAGDRLRKAGRIDLAPRKVSDSEIIGFLFRRLTTLNEMFGQRSPSQEQALVKRFAAAIARDPEKATMSGSSAAFQESRRLKRAAWPFEQGDR